jgi:hypothetical protein
VEDSKEIAGGVKTGPEIIALASAIHAMPSPGP